MMNMLFMMNICKVLKLKVFIFLKEFAVRLLRSNIYLNVKTCKWSESQVKSCTNCGKEPETRLHFKIFCKKTREIVPYSKKKLRKAGLLNFGNNRFPFFVYNDYKIESVENIMMIHTLKYIYRCKYDEIKLNLPHYKAGLSV